MLSLLTALTHLLNVYFAAPLVPFLTRLGIHFSHPHAPLRDNTLTLELIIMFGLLFFFVIARATLSVEKPGTVQGVFELVNDFVGSQGEAIIGHGYEPHVAYATLILLFVVCCNLFGLLPGIETPTANPVVPLALALLTFIYYNWNGVRAQGPVGYVKHFAGPIWWLTPLMFPIEIISHLARIMSLTIRLYANMFASDLLTLVFFSMIPIGVPVVFLGLHFGVALIQAYVFMLLTFIYLSMAVTVEH
ncbi:F0F1 ATP synthase subunit A [Silvibacterium dinghuense]|uniref:ATP synthase subunit a n=1 Tax=Silvibacterium dinghuense TaxID=1560006 RepID=A0A4Q1SDN3_9BACT|nr:F0F1 ATP synthase subunit A [Silvibacterium dinghuense]RXS95171.1 ATP synthase F0 subunit A [Silvibacterium dinghuense]GGH11287.1 ATP synthase subunit a [Silvibacterium dinghuense]